jgi:hypothetical protein
MPASTHPHSVFAKGLTLRPVQAVRTGAPASVNLIPFQAEIVGANTNIHGL